MPHSDEPNRQIFRATAVVVVMTMLSRALGFMRDATIAWAFGATGASDAFMVAYTLPYFLQSVLGVALVTVMVPVVSRYLVNGAREEAWSVTSTICNLMAVFFIAVTLAGIQEATPLVSALAPGFSHSQAAMAVRLTQIMFPSLVFVGLGMLISGVLNAGLFFSVPAIAPGLANLLMILAVIFFSREYYVDSLAWGTLAGFILFFLVQLPNLRAMGFRYRWCWNYRHPEVRRVLQHVPSVLLAISVAQIYLAINRFLASSLPHGSITALDLANRVVGLPLGIFATSLSTALFPTMSRQAARLELDALGRSTAKSLSVLLLIVIPAGAAMILFREPIIRLLFQRGVFDAADTTLTATALYYFVFGMAGIAYNLVLTRTCYALGNISIPIKAAVVSIAVDIILSLPLVTWLAHGGLALANSLAASTNAALLLLLLRRHLPGLKLLPMTRTALLTLVACVPAAAPVCIGLHLWPPAGLGLAALLLQVALLALVGLIVFVAAARALKIPEMSLILAGWGRIRAGKKSS